MGKIQAKQVIDADFVTSRDFSGRASDVVGGDGIVRASSFESLETLDFVDPLNNSAVHGNWTENIPTVGTIVEDASKLSISHTGGTTLSWHSSNTDSPNVYIDVEPYDFIAMVHVKILSNVDQGGGIVHYLSGDKTSYHRWLLEFSSGVYRLDSMQNSADQTYFTLGLDNCWLAILRRGNRFSYYYSTNALNNKPASVNDMTLHKTVDLAFEYTPNRIALLSATWAGTPNAVDSHFSQFSIKYETVSVKTRGYVQDKIDFHDNLNNSAIHDVWTKDIPDVADPDPTITEDNSRLAMTRAGVIALDWWGGTHTAPCLYMPLEPLDFTAMVHVSNLADANINTGGLIIYTDGAKTSFFRIDIRAIGANRYDIRAGKGPSTDLALVIDIGQNSAWLVLARRGFEMMVGYSLNSADNKPAFDDMIITEYESCSILNSYNNNLIALMSMSVGSTPGIDTHFKNFSLVYDRINLYQNDSYLVEEAFTLDGTETPDSVKTFYLTKIPGGAGQAVTSSGYHLFVFRNGQKLGYVGTLADRLHYTYNPAQNSVSIWASGDAEEIEVHLVETVAPLTIPSAGMRVTEKRLQADFTITATSGWGTYHEPDTPANWQEIDNGSGDALEIEITTEQDENVYLEVSGYLNPVSSGDHIGWIGFKIDDTVEYWNSPHGDFHSDVPTAIGLTYNKKFTAGTHTIKVVGMRHSTNRDLVVQGETNVSDGYAVVRAHQYITGGSSYVGHEEDRPPTSPSVYNDEFLDNTLASKWSWFLQSAPAQTDTDKYWLEGGRLHVVTPFVTNTNFPNGRALCQPIPSQNFEFKAKCYSSRYANWEKSGLVLLKSSSPWGYLIGAGFHSTYGSANAIWVNYWNGSWVDPAGGQHAAASGMPNCYKVSYNVTTGIAKFYHSQDGFNWRLLHTSADLTSWGFDYFGLMISTPGSGENYSSFEWFRVDLL